MATVMGIINVNRESFYSASRCTTTVQFSKKAESMIEDGATIIDIGACSTKPGSTPVTSEQEWDYLKEIIDHIHKNYRSYKEVLFSIDTFRANIVQKIFDKIGAFIVNDISAGEDDAHMLDTVGKLGLTYIAMHKRGTPDNMQQLCEYPRGIVNEVAEYFIDFNALAEKHNITNYIIDPGFGFAKTVKQNYELLDGLPQLNKIITGNTGKKHKMLAGLSRKSMIWRPLGIAPEDALCGTVALNLQALINGAEILRVHDVKEGIQCIKLYELLKH